MNSFEQTSPLTSSISSAAKLAKLVLIFSLLLTKSSTALPGGFDSGGGDPLANQFIQIARFLQVTQAKHPIHGVDVSGDLIRGRVDEIEQSLEGLNPLLVFPAGRSVDCFGAPKFGCVKDGKIHIAKDEWQGAPLSDKIEVTTMEIFKSLGVRDRYKKAALVSQALSSRLVLNDGNIILPRSIDRIGHVALQFLNRKADLMRAQILKARAANCVGCSTEQHLTAASTYQFNDRDLIGVVELGHSSDASVETEGCKFNCPGFNEETQSFVILVKIDYTAETAYEPMVISLVLRFTRRTSLQDGRISNSVSLKGMKNPFTH